MATNRDLKFVNQQVSLIASKQKKFDKWATQAAMTNNDPAKFFKRVAKAGYAVNQADVQAAQGWNGSVINQQAQQPQQIAEPSEDEKNAFLNGFNAWKGTQGQNTEAASTPTQQSLPSLNYTGGAADIAKEMNIAEQIKAGKQYDEETSNKNLADLTQRLESDKDLQDKARELLTQRNNDYYNQTGKTDFDAARDNTFNSIPGLNAPTQQTEIEQQAQETQPVQQSQKVVRKVDTAAVNKAQASYDKAQKEVKKLQEQKDKTAERIAELKEKAKKAKSSYEKDAINATIRGLTDTSKDNKAFNEAVAKAKSAREALAKAKQPVVSKNGRRVDTTTTIPSGSPIIKADAQDKKNVTIDKQAQEAFEGYEKARKSGDAYSVMPYVTPGTKEYEGIQKYYRQKEAGQGKLESAIRGFISKPARLAAMAVDALSGGNDAIKAQNQNIKDAEEVSKEAHKLSYGAGNLGFNLAAYTATNPLFDGAATSLGLSGAGAFAANQAAQNLQDIALDTIPSVIEAKDSGTPMSKADIAQNLAGNALGNLVVGGVGLGIDKYRAVKSAQAEQAATEALNGAKRQFLNGAVNNRVDVPEEVPSIASLARQNMPVADTLSAENAEKLARAADMLDEANTKFAPEKANAVKEMLQEYNTAIRSGDEETVAAIEKHLNARVGAELGTIGSPETVAKADIDNMHNAKFRDYGTLERTKPNEEWLMSGEYGQAEYGFNKLAKTISDFENKYGSNDPQIKEILDNAKNDWADLEEVVNGANPIDKGQFEHYARGLAEDIKNLNETAKKVIDGYEGDINAKSSSSTITRLRKNIIGSEAANPEDAARYANSLPGLKNDIDVEPQSNGITVYRGYNRSTDPNARNITGSQSIYDVIGKQNPNEPDMLPFNYYTESKDVAGNYANSDANFLDMLRERAKEEYNDAVINGKITANTNEADWIEERAREAYKNLTGRDDVGIGNVKQHTIRPQNVLDLTELGENPSIDDIYKVLANKTGMTEDEIDTRLVLSNLIGEDATDDTISAYKLLRNQGQTDGGKVGSKFLDLMRENGYDSVRYSENGTNHYAVLPEVGVDETGNIPSLNKTVASAADDGKVSISGKVPGLNNADEIAEDVARKTGKKLEIADNADDLPWVDADVTLANSRKVGDERYDDLINRVETQNPDVDDLMARGEVPEIDKPIKPRPDTAGETKSARIADMQPVYNKENIGADGETYIGDFAKNTERSNMSQYEYDTYFDEEAHRFMRLSENESVRQAEDILANDKQGQINKILGVDADGNKITDAPDLSQVDIDSAMLIKQELRQRARQLEDAGDIEGAKALWKQYNEISQATGERIHSFATGLQALDKWSRTPDGMLQHVENLINGKVTPKGMESKAESIIKKFTKKVKRGAERGIKFDADFEREFTDLATDYLNLGKQIDQAKEALLSARNLGDAATIKDAQKYYDSLSREASVLNGRMGNLAASKIPGSFPNRVKTILMDNMLGNFRTLITRNAGGNVGLATFEQVLERPLASLLDTGVAKATGRRTQAGLSKRALGDYFSGFAKGLVDEAEDFKSGLNLKSGSTIHTTRSGEDTLEDAIAANMAAFRANPNSNVVVKAAATVFDKADQLVKHGLSVGDRPFYEGVYKQTLGDYYDLRTRGLMGEDVQALSDEVFGKYAEAAARMNALAAVYQNDSALAKGLMNAKNALADVSRGVVGVDILSQFSMPFVKTPANVIEKAIEYSPFGMVKNSVTTAKDIVGNIADGGVGGLKGLNAQQQNRLVNETARNLIGSVGTGAGIGLAAKGFTTGSYSDNKKEKAAQKRSGMQEYAANIPGLAQMDVSWMPVVGNMAVSGAAMYDAFKNADAEATIADKVGKGVAAGLNSQLDQSVFQGLQRLMGGTNSYSTEGNGIFSNSINTVTGGVTQVVPSLMRQVASTVDPYQRELGKYGTMEYQKNNVKSMIPGLRETLPVKVDELGDPVLMNQGRSTWQRAVENMILPGKITVPQESALDAEANRIFKETGGNTDAYIPVIDRGDLSQIDGVTEEDYNTYKKNLGESRNKFENALIETEWYKKLDADTQAAILKDTYSSIKSATMSSQFDKSTTDKLANIYNEQGLQSALDYAEANAMSKEMNVNKDGKGTSIGSTSVKGKIDAVENTDLSPKQKADAYYNSLNDKQKAKWSDAYNKYGSEGVYKLSKASREANGESGNSPTIQEILDYAAKNNNLTEEEANMLLGGSATGTIKYYSDNNRWVYVKDGKTKYVGGEGKQSSSKSSKKKLSAKDQAMSDWLNE